MSLHFQTDIQGLSCAACVRRVETALAAVPGVERATANLADGSVDVRYIDPATPPGLREALSSAGYPAKPQQLRFAVEGLSCASCVKRLETALAATDGVTAARVNFADASAVVETTGDTDALLDIARKAGYPLLPEATSAETEDEADTLEKAMWLALVLVLPVFLMEMGSHLYPPLHSLIHGSGLHQTTRVVQFVLIGLALAGPGRQFFTKGIPSLLRRTPDMNALVALGTGAAFVYSTVATFLPGLLPPSANNVYFESAGVIVVLILLGRTLEARAKSRASAAIRALATLQPQTARVVTDDGETDRPSAALQIGDLIRVRPGERIPTDGTITEGQSHINEAMLTGEALPAAKAPGDSVTGASINGDGALLIQVTRIGSDTTLSQIIRMVRDAQGAKLPVQDAVDRITAWFVPAVLATALLTLILWLIFNPTLAIVAAVSVLIIACPCAMGLAVPVSIMVGTGRAAELGILFRGGDALQSLRDVQTIAFDKTGTLTAGHPTLAHVETTGTLTREACLTAAAAVEAQSEHPIARAITEAAPSIAKATDVTALTGHGIRGTVDGAIIHIGTQRLMDDLGIDTSPLSKTATQRAAKGETVFYLAQDSNLAALLSVTDPIKPSAKQAIAQLKATGLHVAMITGDSHASATAIATQLGIDEVHAETLPGAKLDIIRTLQKTGKTAFVGDGINDAPALAAADVGIALGSGTDVAMESADVVLMSGDPARVTDAIDLSRATMRNITQNLGWAFGYNILLIPVAAGLLYPILGLLLSPMLAAGAMALSSVAVVANALRLKRMKGHT